MKKILKTALALLMSLSIMTALPVYGSFSASGEETTSAQAEEDTSGTAEILVVIIVFTVTTAVVSVLTYKIARKKNLSSDDSESGISEKEDS